MAKKICSICGAEMAEGYYCGDRSTYYCSDDCLHHHYTDEEWEELYTDDGDNYWTEWYEESYWHVTKWLYGQNVGGAYFDSLDDAVAYCNKEGWLFRVDDFKVGYLAITAPYDEDFDEED